MRLRVLALITLLPLGALVAVPAAASAADPMAGAPAVGACYDLTQKDAFSESTSKAPVACSSRHTLLVGAVGPVPDSVGWDDDEGLWKTADGICGTFWRTYYDVRSPDRLLTLHQGTWLMPTPAQRRAGSRWISCGIGLSDGARLLPLSEGGPATAAKKPPASVARCAVGKSFRTVACSKRHEWRATYAFATRATGGEKAVHDAVQRAVKRRCPARTKAARWLWTYRTLPRDNTYAVACLDHTRR